MASAARIAGVGRGSGLGKKSKSRPIKPLATRVTLAAKVADHSKGAGDMNRWILASAAVGGLVTVLVGGCGAAQKDAGSAAATGDSAMGGPKVADANTAPAKIKTANTICPIGGHDWGSDMQDVTLTRPWKGSVIGFCCDGCSTAFDAMNEQERDDVLALAKKNIAG